MSNPNRLVIPPNSGSQNLQTLQTRFHRSDPVTLVTLVALGSRVLEFFLPG